MNRNRWSAVDDYFASLLVTEEPVEGEVPPHGVSALQGRLLELLARLAGARRILELGTLAGYSTIWLARGLADGGRVVTLEVDAGYADIARDNLKRAGVAGRVEVVVGPALETLPQLGPEPFDLIFLDADKGSNPAYLPWALALSRPGTLIAADNVVRGGAVTDPAGENASVRGVRRFTELVAAEPRLAATAIQTVGAKGHDGFLLALVDS
ncbi:MAG: O-methyltransferase [Solirubrobacterales bacterium]|nr:O-methyltransferase [Solirubrobacterales bacterium]